MTSKHLASLLAVAVSLAASAALGACGAASDLDPPTKMPHRANADVDWRDQVIYQVVIDRFDNGDPNNDYNVAPTIPGRYHGGDWQGVIDKLDYLQHLGVTALWISPVVKNTESDAGFASYHGYWTQDFLRPNPHFGDLYKLRELVDSAHARGMLVILDVVTNHVGQLFYYDINGNGQPDDFLSGGGLSHTCVQICSQSPTACSPDELTYCDKGKDYLERIIEWDPEYDPRGVQGWTSLGFSGPATIRFPDWPDQDRTVPARPPAWFGWPNDKPWFDDPSWYHRKGRVYVWWHEADYSREFVREQETEGDFPGGLKDLDTDNPDVADALTRSFQYWIAAADFDGFRIDTVKHIDRPEVEPNKRGFWGKFTDGMRDQARDLGKSNFFIFGEAFDGDDALIGAYTQGGTEGGQRFGRFDSVFYFSQKYRVIDAVFKQGQPTHNIECMYDSRMGRNPGDAWCQANGYPAGPTFGTTPHRASADGGVGLAPQQLAVNFLDNHDLPRFLYDGTLDQLRVAMGYLFTWDGIPCLYYGTEQAFHGGVDPANREDMWRGNVDAGYPGFDETNDMFLQTQAWIALRKDREALRRGDVAIKWSVQESGARRDAGIFAFERATANDKVLVVLNAGDVASESCAPQGEGGACMTASFPPGTVLRDLAPGSDAMTFTVGPGGSVDVPVPPHTVRVLAP
ncbi:MAG TPA: alpha-amylase family glycosyl hydrolase [Kofleriaceae bacterium]|nr:alpha-amylase family glycosyl hydrolase [Kofleriaceae bacterium]